MDKYSPGPMELLTRAASTIDAVVFTRQKWASELAEGRVWTPEFAQWHLDFLDRKLEACFRVIDGWRAGSIPPVAVIEMMAQIEEVPWELNERPAFDPDKVEDGDR